MAQRVRDTQSVKYRGEIKRKRWRCRDSDIFGRGLLLCIKRLPGISLRVIKFRTSIGSRAGESRLLVKASLPAIRKALKYKFARRLAFDKDDICAIHGGHLSRGMTVSAFCKRS